MTWDRIEPERVVEPSRIRRGRMATSPVWYVTTPDGDVWRFSTRKDARAFIAARGCARHVDGSLLCPSCYGQLDEHNRRTSEGERITIDLREDDRPKVQPRQKRASKLSRAARRSSTGERVA